jgi:hypothetical protein
MRTQMTIEQKEQNAAEFVIQNAYHHVMGYAKPEDIEAATVGLLWAAFELEAKRFGLESWRGLKLD